MIKILITSEAESEINSIKSILMELQSEAELLFYSRTEDVTRCLLEENIDICVIDYETPNHRFMYIMDMIQTQEIPTVVAITAEPQNYSRLWSDNNLTRNTVLLKPLDRDRTLFYVQRTIDQNMIAQVGEYRPEVQGLWRRTKPQLAEGFWTELLYDRLSRRVYKVGQKENQALYQSAVAVGIKEVDSSYVLPIAVFPRGKKPEVELEYLNRKNMFETLSHSVIIREDEGYTYFLSDTERVVLFYPYDMRLSANRVAHRCFQFCKEIEQQFKENLYCIIGEPCHVGDLSEQWNTLRSLAEKYRFRGECIFFLGDKESGELPMLYAPVAQWAKLVLDGQTDQIRKEASVFFETNRKNPGLTTDYVTNLVYDIDRYVTIASAQMELNLAELANERQIRKLFISAFKSPDAFLSWITALSELCIECRQKGRNSGSILDAAKEYIQRNLGGNLSRQIIADYAHVSQNYLARLFREKMGTTISDYIMAERIERAKEYLAKSSLSVTEISQRVGFGSSTYFSSSFKKYVGNSPQGYRKERDTSDKRMT